MERFACPCCGCLTIEEPAGWEICPVCFWEDDGFVYRDGKPDESIHSGANGMTLAQARENFKATGACDKKSADCVRKPFDGEITEEYLRLVGREHYSLIRAQLVRIVKKYDLQARTVSSFWNSYDDYLTDEITADEARGYGLTDRDSVEIGSAGYSYSVPGEFGINYGHDTIEVYIRFFRRGSREHFGEYWCIYDVSGKFVDDYFVIG